MAQASHLRLFLPQHLLNWRTAGMPAHTKKHCRHCNISRAFSGAKILFLVLRAPERAKGQCRLDSNGFNARIFFSLNPD
jgi:hypothetical protein